tara:strand:+ start:123 stop:788 length:666 start_codon:yes stop_codon:yes gene_type:complete
MLTTTIYKKNIHDLDEYKFKIIKDSKNIKLGKKVIKGMYNNYKLKTVTLIERKTCPADCVHWEDCYGNNMPFAHRIDHKDQNLLQKRIYNELLNSTNQLLLIRLHVLGDFFNVKYVKFWSIMLNTFKNIAIYGYTANNINSKIELSRDIAKEIIKLNYSKHSHIRFSNDLNNPFSANSYDIVKPVKGKSILCPVQENKTANCGTCGLCWNQNSQSIIFKTH